MNDVSLDSIQVEIIFDQNIQHYDATELESVKTFLSSNIGIDRWDFGSGKSAIGILPLPYELGNLAILVDKTVGVFGQVPLKINHFVIGGFKFE